MCLCVCVCVCVCARAHARVCGALCIGKSPGKSRARIGGGAHGKPSRADFYLNFWSSERFSLLSSSLFLF